MANCSNSIENRNKLCINSSSTDYSLDILSREVSFFAQPNISVQPDTRLDITDCTAYENASVEQKVRIPFTIVICIYI